MRILLDPATAPKEPPPRGHRLLQLTATGTEMECAERWSRRAIPEELPPGILAHRLGLLLQQFSYTLDNPSGGADNPLQDFLERSHAGHCEYFASALAAMLRRRGVPARVVNGYRLGPWIPEGGYWLVTQNEAHSWVEYYDSTLSVWRAEDPTPAGVLSGMAQKTVLASLQRWLDALRYQWDRHVVRFSDDDQMAGMDWIRDRMMDLSVWRARFGAALRNAVIVLAALLALVWAIARRSRTRQAVLSGGIPALGPLLRRTRKLAPPMEGETMRAWLLRLAELRPQRTNHLRELAEEAEAEAYGSQRSGRTARLAKEEAKAWGRPIT